MEILPYGRRLTNKWRRNEGTGKSPFGRICNVLKLAGKSLTMMEYLWSKISPPKFLLVNQNN